VQILHKLLLILISARNHQPITNNQFSPRVPVPPCEAFLSNLKFKIRNQKWLSAFQIKNQKSPIKNELSSIKNKKQLSALSEPTTSFYLCLRARLFSQSKITNQKSKMSNSQLKIKNQK